MEGYVVDVAGNLIVEKAMDKMQEILGKAPYAEWSQDDVEMILDEVYKWCCEVSGPLNSSGDQEGCRLEDGKIKAVGVGLEIVHLEPYKGD